MAVFPFEQLMYIGIFIGVLLVFEGLHQMLTRSETEKEARSRRMKMVASGLTAQERLGLLKPQETQWPLHRLPLVGRLPAQLRQAGMTVRPDLFLAACIALAAVTVVIASVFLGPLLAVVGGIALGAGGPLLLLKQVRKKRVDRIVSQLPDALDLMARGLKVGHPLNATLASVAEEMPDPIGTEFGILVDQISYGDDLSDATNDLADRIDQEDVRYLAAAISIQQGTGGDLSEVLNTLSRVIRDRIAMRRKVKAISAEGRMTAVFLSILPLIIFGITMITSPEYYGNVMDDPLFMPGAIIVTFLIVLNYLVMRRLVDLRI